MTLLGRVRRRMRRNRIQSAIVEAVRLIEAGKMADAQAVVQRYELHDLQQMHRTVWRTTEAFQNLLTLVQGRLKAINLAESDERIRQSRRHQ